MTIEQVQKAYRATPFKPFTLNLADGRSVTVRHPEFMMMTPGGRTVVVATGDDSVEIIDLLLVTSLSTGNGTIGS
jgi:hypothetical protein